MALVNMIFSAGRALAQSERDTLVATAPMGWNRRNKSASNVGKDLIKTVADAMAGNGMEEAAYKYVVIDDCWQVSRDLIVPDPGALARWPRIRL